MQIFFPNVTAQIGDLFEAGDVAPGMVLHLLDCLPGIEQVVGGTGVEPCEIPVEPDDMQLVAAQVFKVDVCNFQGLRLRAMSMT